MKELSEEGLKAFADTSADERAYARSIKIRMATQEWMMKLANSAENDSSHAMVYESIDRLCLDCAMYVKKSGWDRKAANPITTKRWVNVYSSFMGPFKLAPYGPGGFVVTWRDGYSRAEVVAELGSYRKR